MQSPINIPNGSGAQVRANINGAIESVASFYSGTIDPATMTPSSARPFMVWADTANSLVKQRNADNTSWGNVGTIVDGKFLFKVADTANTLVTPRNINGVAFDGSQDITINTSAEGAYPENFVASGRKITDVTGNQITIGAGKNVIDNVPIPFIANSLTVPARSTSLIADKADGTTVLVPATYPTSYIDDNTVGFWVFNQTGAGANIPNSAVGVSSIAVANDLVPTGGITSVGGWADYATKLDGTSGYYTSQNSTGIPIGASAREFSIMFTLNSFNNTVNNFLMVYGGTSGVLGIQWYYKSSGVLYICFGGTEYSTNYTLEIGKTYKITWKITGTTSHMLINGVLIYTLNVTPNTTVSLLYVGRYVNATNYAGITLHYLEVRNTPRTDELTAQIANKLCLPCFYDKSNGTRGNITEILPADSVSLGIVRGDTTGVIMYNDSEYQYGRREGAYGGNRRVFLGWKYFSGDTTLTWDNPFGTRKVRLQAVWAQDNKGTNECDCISAFYNTDGGFGAYAGSYDMVPSTRIVIKTYQSGVVKLNNAWQTSGYIGVYVEIVSDD